MIILFFVVAFAVAAVAGIAGFGAVTLTIPLLSWIIGIKQAITLIAFFHGFSNLFKLLQLWKSVDIRSFLWYGIPATGTAIIGV